jgi:hypothetical protein
MGQTGDFKTFVLRYVAVTNSQAVTQSTPGFAPI